MLARLLAVYASQQAAGTIKELYTYAEKVLDRERPGEWNQALMDLGRHVCTYPVPQCEICPVRSYCAAYKEVHRPSDASYDLADTNQTTDGSSCAMETLVDIEDCCGICEAPQRPLQMSDFPMPKVHPILLCKSDRHSR